MQSVTIVDGFRPGDVVRPTHINEWSALSVPAYWCGVNFISENLASFPRLVCDPDRGTIKHPLDRILERRPNQLQTATELWTTLFFHFTHWGNGYLKINRLANGEISSIVNLLPSDVAPFRLYQTLEDFESVEQFYYYYPLKTAFAASDIIHVKGLSHDGMVGYSPIAVLTGTFQRAITIDRYQTQLLQKGTVIRGAIEIPQGVSDEAAEGIKSLVRNQFTGSTAERDLIVLPDGAKLSNVSLSSEQVQMIEQSKYTNQQMAQVLRVQPQFLFEYTDAKYNNMTDQMGEEVVKYTFRPRLDKIEDELTLKFLTEAEQEEGYRIHCDTNVLTRGNQQAQETIAINSVKGGLRTRNEARAMLGLAPDTDPGSDKLSVLGDTTPQEQRQQSSSSSSSEDANASQNSSYEALKPLFVQAAETVENKTVKAFENMLQVKSEDKAISFSDSQKQYIDKLFQPLAASAKAITGKVVDISAFAEAYSTEILKRYKGENAKTCNEVLGDFIK